MSTTDSYRSGWLNERITTSVGWLNERITENRDALHNRITENRVALNERITENRDALHNRITENRDARHAQINALHLRIDALRRQVDAMEGNYGNIPARSPATVVLDVPGTVHLPNGGRLETRYIPDETSSILADRDTMDAIDEAEADIAAGRVVPLD